MEVPVLIEPINGSQYRATLGEPLGLTAEGASEAEALKKLHELVANRLVEGVKMVGLKVADTSHPWRAFSGTLKDHPLLEEWKQAMADYRQAIENDPDVL